MRKPAIIVAVLVFCLAAVGVILVLRKPDPHYSADRQHWKDRAILAIREDLKKPDHLAKRVEKIPEAEREWDTSGYEWLTRETILCKDGTWVAYRSRCHKQDAKVHDIFIGRASNGAWYYSDYHFCIDAMVLMMNGQPASLGQFRADYHLEEFDGTSDDALRPTLVSKSEP